MKYRNLYSKNHLRSPYTHAIDIIYIYYLLSILKLPQMLPLPTFWKFLQRIRLVLSLHLHLHRSDGVSLYRALLHLLSLCIVPVSVFCIILIYIYNIMTYYNIIQHAPYTIRWYSLVFSFSFRLIDPNSMRSTV
jgi:hypothetical protein